ncbi:MAG: hypothetical protein ACREVI_12740 [Steroidobacteraceae bacterium]
MARWLHAEYRDFHDFPRVMVCTNADGTYLFSSPFDPASGRYADYYEVYRLPAMSESETCLSWFGLETRALERLPDLPVRAFPFDTARREFLEYDSIRSALASA